MEGPGGNALIEILVWPESTNRGLLYFAGDERCVQPRGCAGLYRDRGTDITLMLPKWPLPGADEEHNRLMKVPGPGVAEVHRRSRPARPKMLADELL